MENFIYTLLAINHSHICNCSVLRARVGGNANVVSQILCLESTEKFKDTRGTLRSEHGSLPE